MNLHQLKMMALKLFSTWFILASLSIAKAEHDISKSGLRRPIVAGQENSVCKCPDPVKPGLEGVEPQSKVAPASKVAPPSKVGPVSKVALLPIPEECLTPRKVVPDLCKNLPIEFCMSYFKARISENKLNSASQDDTAREAEFCLKQLRSQLFE